MNNKFYNTMIASDDKILQKRAKRVTEDVEQEMHEIIRDKKKEVRGLENDLDNMEDFGPDNKLSLNPTKDGFNAKSWADKYHRTSVELELAKQELKIAEANYEKWFSDQEPQQCAEAAGQKAE